MVNVTQTPEIQEKLTPELEKFIQQWVDQPGSLIMVLHRVQEEYGWVPRSVAFQVADRMGIPLAQVYGVLTFYHFFKLQKPGKYRISVCMGTACYLKGGQDLLQELEHILGVGINTVTPDGLFSVEAVRCLGCCGMTPMMSVNGHMHGNISKDEVAGILAKYRAQG